MGRGPYSNRKTVEQTTAITTKMLRLKGLFKGGEITEILSLRGGQKIRLSIFTENGEGWARFEYDTVHIWTDEKKHFDYKVKLTSSPCKYGGFQWMFICPVNINDKSCGRRIRALYFRKGHFGCRHCQNLTYESSKTNHCPHPLAKIFNF